jgi:hypothetical protein
MDAKYCREKAALCDSLADGLSLNNPARFELMDLAEYFVKRAKELETQARLNKVAADAARLDRAGPADHTPNLWQG